MSHPLRCVLALTVLLAASSAARAEEPRLKTEEQKTIYVLGLSIARDLGALRLSEAELEVLKAGLTDGVVERPPRADPQTYRPKIQQLIRDRQTAAAAAEKKAAEKFLENAAAQRGAVKTESGLIYLETRAGTGPRPTALSTVKLHYRGTLRDGAEFESSYARAQPVIVAANRAIPCWTEALQKMKVGGKARLVCPSALAYGDRGAPPLVQPGAVLVFEIELLDLVKDEGK